MKYFIITVDTEGDNLWEYVPGTIIHTQNSRYIPRFQELCNQFNFKPVWLINYEMANDDYLVEYIKPKLRANLCEVGIHLHAWNNPPLFELQGPFNGNSYLIEYPLKVRREKFEVLFNLLSERFNFKPVSHRAGRWAMDDDYFKLLEEFGITTDCSFTPGINWQNNPGSTTMNGSNYSSVRHTAHWVGKIFEVPVTILGSRNPLSGSFKQKIKTMLLGKQIWLRPSSFSLEEMKYVCKKSMNNDEVDYVEFMIHSSEFMPGGSPYFRDNESIEMLFNRISGLFKYASSMGYIGVTLQEYYQIKNRG